MSTDRRASTGTLGRGVRRTVQGAARLLIADIGSARPPANVDRTHLQAHGTRRAHPSPRSVGDRFTEGKIMGSKNKNGREIRKPKQPAKPKTAKTGTDATRVERQVKLPHAK